MSELSIREAYTLQHQLKLNYGTHRPNSGIGVYKKTTESKNTQNTVRNITDELATAEYNESYTEISDTRANCVEPFNSNLTHEHQ